jgi:pyrrolidone-carboxylate peptidase
MFRILLTGFGLWTGVSYNPTQVVARRLHGAILDGARFGLPHRGKVTSAILDVAWDDGTTPSGERVRSATRTLTEAVASVRPHILLSLGVTPDSWRTFDVEPVAFDSSRQADVRGEEPRQERWHPKEPESIEIPFPVAKVLAALRSDGFDAISKAGLGYFLCERVAYEGALLARRAKSGILTAGFIHTPNPLFATVGSWERSPATLDEEERERLEQYECAVEKAVGVALEVCLANLPTSATRPRSPFAMESRS